jgi:putative Mn2+ efflux pump MntP
MSLSDLTIIFTLAIGLSMDAFAVAIAQGSCLEITKLRLPLSISITFGLYQAVMPLIGFLVGSSFALFMCHLDHWIALILLGGVGLKMIAEGIVEAKRQYEAKLNNIECPKKVNCNLSFRRLTAMGIATSIDALAVGLTFSMLCIPIWPSIIIIGLTTFSLSFIGVFIGKKTGSLFGTKMEIGGGLILIIIGIIIVIEHLIKGI